jgi:hypothetical protein
VGMMNYDYEYNMRFTDPGYYITLGCEGDTMKNAQQLLDTFRIRGIAIVGNVYFYNMQDLRHFMFYWKASRA